LAELSAPRRRVADFPRPPAIETVTLPVRIVLGGQTIAQAGSSWRILETFHPPTYYLPVAAFTAGALERSQRASFCEWKGSAHYCAVLGGGRRAADAAWGYDDPSSPYEALRDHVAVYAGKMDACFVGDEKVVPQPGGFYGGWITAEFEGPFKGAPGTLHW
jgi:uncharacterized protein (DUF427 family)